MYLFDKKYCIFDLSHLSCLALKIILNREQTLVGILNIKTAFRFGKPNEIRMLFC